MQPQTTFEPVGKPSQVTMERFSVIHDGTTAEVQTLAPDFPLECSSMKLHGCSKGKRGVGMRWPDISPRITLRGLIASNSTHEESDDDWDVMIKVNINLQYRLNKGEGKGTKEKIMIKTAEKLGDIDYWIRSDAPASATFHFQVGAGLGTSAAMQKVNLT